MGRPVSRVLYTAGFVLIMLVGALFFILASVPDLGNPVHAAVVYSLWILGPLGALLGTVAWVGALVRMARLRRWGWFAALLLINGMMFAYILHGPDEPA